MSFFHNSKKGATVALLLLAIALSYLTATWPDNLAARAVYRLLGKHVPVKSSEDLQNVKIFLSAKRSIDARQYAAARAALEPLSEKVDVNFIFFHEVFFYLGYVYDVTREFPREEALYARLALKDSTFSRFMNGIYHIRAGNVSEGRQELLEALKLDDTKKRLGKYRRIAVRALQETSPGGRLHQ